MGKIWVWREILAAPRYKVATSNLKRSAHMSPDTCKREPIDLVLLIRISVILFVFVQKTAKSYKHDKPDTMMVGI
jgi:hypothetical protein